MKKSKAVKNAVLAPKPKTAKAQTSKAQPVKASAKKAGTVTEKPSTARLEASGAGAWTFLTNYAHVLICLAREPDLRLRDVAARVGITERAVQRIVADLEAGGVLARSRDGRCNRYEIQPNVALRHPLEAHCSISDLIAMVGED